MLDEPLTGLDPRQRADMIALFRRLGAEGRCVLVSSHVLDEVERLGSQILVMSQGRLAAAGDFRELRALMDDRPLRVRVRTDRPRELAGALLEGGTVVGARLDGEQALELDTDDVRELARALAPVARDTRRKPARGRAARRGPRGRLPLPGAAMSAADATAARPRATSSLDALYRLLLRTQVTVPRLLGVGALGGLAVLLGVVSRWDDDPVQAGADVVASYGLGVVVPLAALWFGTSAIGDLVEDRLLVYLWLKPVARWQLPAAAILATATVVVPLTAVPLAAAALAAGSGELALSTLLAAALAALRLRRPVRRRRAVVQARRVVGARVRGHLGERRRVRVGGHGAVHRDELGALDRLQRARDRRAAGRPLGRGRGRRASGDRPRRLAGGDDPLPPRRR